MATSPFPLNFLSPPFISSSSPSLFFLIPYSHTHSSNNSRTLKVRFSCSQQTIQHDTQQINPTKKKRKPRPSFLEQIHEKWSLKTTSLKENFPWQEEKREERVYIEEVEEPSQLFPGVVASESEINGSPTVSDPVSLISENRRKLAPWVHRSKHRETQLGSEARNSRKSTDRGNDVNGFHGHCKNDISGGVLEELKNLEREVNGNNNSEGGIEIGTTQIGLSKEEEIFPVEGDKVGSFNGQSLSIDHGSSNFKGSTDKYEVTRLPWERKIYKNIVDEERLKNMNARSVEKLIPEPELKRLRNVALRMLERIKVRAAGVTQALVDSIHEKWKQDEVVKLKFEGPPAMNMKRTHEILESRTGGLVIWRSGSSVVLYRGMTYKLPCVQSYAERDDADPDISKSSKDLVNVSVRGEEKYLTRNTEASADPSTFMKNLSEKELMDLNELNSLLDELGPRFKDWSGRDPVPVDADLLPAIGPGYKTPPRLLPYRVRSALRNEQMTFFRRTARTLPPHFALGRNRELQGLAMAMVKLWERSAIAKIAIKHGVQNTCNERMAEELKTLTGGTLLSRNKDYIVFYRGNDFLPPGVTEALVEAQKVAAIRQDEEEQARKKVSNLFGSNAKISNGPLIAGTLAETMAATSHWANQPSSEEIEKMRRDSALSRHASLVRYLEKKLSFAKGKVKKAEKVLMKLQKHLEPAELPVDLETISDEERVLFRKIGHSMKPFLLLGRRGVYDGTIENMHLHWKYRELVKIIVKGKSYPQVKHIAISLEAESGGVLVSLDKTTQGYAVIVYRGKNYRRPLALRPKKLLSKRQALAWSIELQRREALKHHIRELQEKIEKLKAGLEDMKTVEEIDEETFYTRLDGASDADDLQEDEDEEKYLKIYDSENEGGKA